MILLLDTQLLIWATAFSPTLSKRARALLTDPDNQLVFSVASIWEASIKQARGRPDFNIDTHLLRRALLSNGWEELPVTSEHALATMNLPPLHKDPFDRLLLAQAISEGMTLLTSDSTLAGYPGPIIQA
ncbi:MAG: twitching motility protein PilT [Caulobacter sp. 12-67-6]|nr:MAG: twitching motility protein PilT [Caulobacter sp. 12-67-6]OYX69974.1 MAG: twitching motility protein PilT [Caulobacter sp. 32-67-35]OZA72948.1 MAG: twitching motility protein PilT [Caulobacter sp. 39-67-4]HQR89475.1 type II toxin-antitoxin system VapC family toxin [Caulobacter sp.]